MEKVFCYAPCSTTRYARGEGGVVGRQWGVDPSYAEGYGGQAVESGVWGSQTYGFAVWLVKKG